MSPEFIKKWEHILEDVEKQKIPIHFIKKIIIKLDNKKQQSLNVERFFNQGLDPEQIEDVIGRKLYELDDQVVSLQFILNVKNIADVVQPTTDEILKKL